MQAARLAHEADFGAELAAARAGLIEQSFEIEALKTRLSKLLRLSFGPSSEKLRAQVEQLELTLGNIDEPLAETGSGATANDDATAAADDHHSAKPARRPLPEAFSRDVVEHAAPCCGKRVAAPIRRLCFTATRRTAKASIHGRTWQTSKASCRRTAMPGSPGSMATRWSKPLAWRMSVGNHQPPKGAN